MNSSRLFLFISFCHADDRKYLISQEIFHSVQNDKEGICFIMLPDSKSLDDLNNIFKRSICNTSNSENYTE